MKSQIVDSVCATRHEPIDVGTGRPATTLEARAKVSMTPEQLARVFDPRSWGTCFPNFETQRVTSRTPSGKYSPLARDTDPIGRPWTPVSDSHLFWERVTIQSDVGASIFENILKVESFTVNSDRARLEFTLHESRRLEIAPLGVRMNECVTIDEGYLEAVALTRVGEPWSQIEMVKKVQFVDLSRWIIKNSFGSDSGELLNYLAPASLCMWLALTTKGPGLWQV